MPTIESVHHEVPLADKVAFLERPDSFPDRPAQIETVETHFAWAFLSKDFVYKLKKPIRFGRIDFRNREARRAYCELEVTLNRRLAEATYLAVVPLTASAAGLRLGGDGPAIDWLVGMRRLPRERTLEALAAAGEVSDAGLRAVVRKLARFYRRTPSAPWNGVEYRQWLERGTRDYAEQLTASGAGLDAGAIRRVAAAQALFVASHGDALERRAEERRVVDAHGDLRPEHVFLTADPEIIDCLEFSIELRWLDTAEEISFLVLECDRRGCAAVGERVLELYRDIGRDAVPAELLDFYRSRRALVRALLSAWRVPGAPPEVAARWRDGARWYVDTAAASMARATGTPCT